MKFSSQAILALTVVFLTMLTVYGKPAKTEDEKLEVTGKWEIRGQVNKLYDTPLGEVYDFTMSDYYDFGMTRKDSEALNLNSIQFDLRKFMDNSEKIRRFIVLDFKIRTFPAITPVKNPTLNFSTTRSAVDPENIHNYLSLNGLFRFETGESGALMQSPYALFPNPLLWQIAFDRFDLITLLFTFDYYPYYEVTSFRFIFDTYKGGVFSANINGHKFISPHYEDCSERITISRPVTSRITKFPANKTTKVNGERRLPPQSGETAQFIVPVRSFGICIQLNKDMRKKQYRQFIEVSRPVVTLTDREEVLRTLEPVQRCTDYPYGGYSEYFGQKEITKTDNPDAVYAYAMQLLNGEDLPSGVEMLKRAAARQHIFAMYQLGVCYFRGIGVEPDLQKALIWLKYAVDYSLPDALALAAVVQMHNSKSLYINDQARATVKQGLNTLKPFVGKHDNWILDALFDNGSPGRCEKFFQSSPRLEFMDAKSSYTNIYYRDTVDPKIIHPPKKRTLPPPQPELKNPLKFNDSTFKRQAVNERTAADFGIAPSIELKDKKMPNKYYDVRVEDEDFWPLHKDFFKNAVNGNFIPAILYHGRYILAKANLNVQNRSDVIQLVAKPINHSCSIVQKCPDGIPTENMLEALESALQIFDKGAKLGSMECEVEALHCRVRLGTVKKEDFTPELDIKLADYPLYHMLKYMVENPDAPGIKEFLSRKYEDARQIWRSSPTGWNNFLLGAEALYQYYNYGFDTAWYRLYYRDIKDVETAFKYLDDAVKQNIPPSQYLCGRQYLEGMRSKGQLDEILHKKIGADLLKAAEQAGYARASYLLVKQQFITNIYSTDAKWLEQLKPLLEAKDADSWLLAGDIYARLKSPGSDKKALDAYGKAAEFGSIRAWHTLGMWYYNKPAAGKEKEQNKLKAAECWRKFVKLDREARMQDINDVYWPGIKKPPVFKLGDGDYSIRGLSDKEVRRYYETY